MAEKEIFIDYEKATEYALKRVRERRKYPINDEDFKHDCKILLDYINFEEGGKDLFPINIFSYAVSHNFRMHTVPCVWHIYTSLKAYYWDLGGFVCDPPMSKEDFLSDIVDWVTEQHWEYCKKKPISKKELHARLSRAPRTREVLDTIEEVSCAPAFAHLASKKDVSEPENVVLTGIDALDQLTTGLHKTDLVVFGSHPAHGKTSMLVSLAHHIGVEQKVPVGIFSLEMSKEQMIRRLIMYAAEIDGDHLRKGNLDDSEHARMEATVKSLSQSPIFIDDTPGIKLDEFKSKAESLVRDHQVQCILIDYAQLFNEFSLDYTNNLRLMHAIKQIAVDLNVAIVLTAQARKRYIKCMPPEIFEFRSELCEVSDMFCMLCRPEVLKMYVDEDGNDLHGVFDVLVAKNNHGSTGTVRFHFIPQFAKIV